MEAQIKHIRYKSEPTKYGSYYIAETDHGIVKGRSPIELTENMNVRLDGNWQISKFNGQKEFLFHSIVPCLPVSSKARFWYACSITKGIGEMLSRKIWEAIGESWEDSDLDGIPGIGRETRSAWAVTLQEIHNQAERAEAFAWMMDAGLTANMAAAAWNAWDKNAAGIIDQNPYRLVELPNYGFKAADQLVQNSKHWDIGELDPRRIKAAILYILEENSGNGNTAMKYGMCLAKTEDICKGINAEQFHHACADDPAIILINREWGEDATSIGREKDYENETIIWRRWR